MLPNKLNQFIDHTNLKPFTSEEEIIKLCNEAKANQFYSVCINPYFVKLAKEQLGVNSPVKVCTVVGFPLGANTVEQKMFEAHISTMNGADEIDMVINITELRKLNKEYCLNEINKIKHTIGNKILKVIVETAYLNEQQKQLAAEIILASNADFIKTSTGFAPSGASVDDIKLWKQILKDQKQIKAAGGIRTKEQAIEMIAAGADRIGSSNSLEIVK